MPNLTDNIKLDVRSWFQYNRPSFLLIANIGAQNPIKTPHPVPRTMSHVPLSRIKALLPAPIPCQPPCLAHHEPKAIKSCTRPVHRSIALSCALPEMKRYTCAHYSSPSSSPSPSLSPSPSGSSSPPSARCHLSTHAPIGGSGDERAQRLGAPEGSDERARCSRASKEDRSEIRSWMCSIAKRCISHFGRPEVIE